MRHDVDFTTWRRNLSCVTTQRFLRRHVISRAFLSKRRKRKSVGQPGVYSHSSNSCSNSQYSGFREKFMEYRHKKRQTPNCIGICLQSFMGDDYLTSIFFVVLASSLGVSFGISTSRTPSATFAEIFSRSASSGRV